MNDVQAKFDLQKLRWLNAEYIMKASNTRLIPLVKEHLEAAGLSTAGVPDAYLAKVLDLYKIRIKTLSEFPAMTDCFFREDFAFDEEGQEAPRDAREPRVPAVLADRLAGITDFSHAAIEAALPRVRRGARHQGRPDHPPRPHGRQRQDQGRRACSR